jgi:RecT family
MTDTLTEQRLTKRDLVEGGIDALDLSKAGSMPVHHEPTGGVSRVDIAQVIELGKIMAASQDAVPEHCRGNVGVCVRICFQAVEWAMSPFAVADLSYIVNKRLAYMSQLLHAVVEGRAPLQHRLECNYDGDGGERTCTVVGYFTSGDTREYTTPMIKDIRVKNSPLWKDDPDQQLFYYASRAWARKWVPDVLLGVYTREELLAQPTLGREDEDTAPGLHARLTGSDRSSKEGHDPSHAARELSKIEGAGQTIEHDDRQIDLQERPDLKKAKAGVSAKAKPKERTTDRAKHDSAPIEQKDTAPADDAPRTAAQYLKYAKAWIKAETDPDALFNRWKNERSLRNKLGVTAEDREPLDKLIVKRREELSQ